MSRILIFIAILSSIGLIGCNKEQPSPSTKNAYEVDPYLTGYGHYIEPTSSEFIGKVRLNSNVSIRLLILKHCPDNIADIDASQAVQAANVALDRGLTIQTLGNYHVNKEGRTESMAWGSRYNLNDLEGLKNFISEQMKVDVVHGDTFIVYTIGHGSGNGSIMRLGQRGPVMKIIAEAAEENNQETLWWQLSCHAAANLPPISSLTEEQQELFSMTASSPANELSYFNTQGKQFSALFNSLAARSKEIDPDSNEIITAQELSNFLSSKFGDKRGKLVFAKSPEEPILGLTGGLANAIPIRDQNSPQGDYPRNYIPFPQDGS